jgi:hypothetical protein
MDSKQFCISLPAGPQFWRTKKTSAVGSGVGSGLARDSRGYTERRRAIDEVITSV